MLIWLGKQYLGQADKPQVTGKDGGPIQSLDLTKVSADDLETLEQIFGAIARSSDE